MVSAATVAFVDDAAEHRAVERVVVQVHEAGQDDSARQLDPPVRLHRRAAHDVLDAVPPDQHGGVLGRLHSPDGSGSRVQRAVIAVSWSGMAAPLRRVL